MGTIINDSNFNNYRLLSVSCTLLFSGTRFMLGKLITPRRQNSSCRILKPVVQWNVSQLSATSFPAGQKVGVHLNLTSFIQSLGAKNTHRVDFSFFVFSRFCISRIFGKANEMRYSIRTFLFACATVSLGNQYHHVLVSILLSILCSSQNL